MVPSSRIVGRDQAIDRDHGMVSGLSSAHLKAANGPTDQWTSASRGMNTREKTSHKTPAQGGWKQDTTARLQPYERRHGVLQPPRRAPGEPSAKQVMTPASAAAPDANRHPIRYNQEEIQHDRKHTTD